MDEKGKNLATKEDIEEITRKTEEVQQEFREGFELFSNDVKFKYIQSSKEIIARKKKSIKHSLRKRLTKNNSVLMKQKDL